MLTMYDAVTASNLDPNAQYVCYYTDGIYANGAAVRRQCPHAQYLGITVHGGIADCCDCEVGDMTVSQAEAWVNERLAAGAYRPCVYADADRWANQGLLSGLAGHGDKIRRWVAAYPGTGPNVPPGYDAHQYADGKVDTSVCLDNFFAPKPISPHGVAHVLLSYDLAKRSWTHHSLPGLVTWGSEDRWASVEVQLGEGGSVHGQWRTESLPYNAPPLGG
jgi:hypothetical protein